MINKNIKKYINSSSSLNIDTLLIKQFLYPFTMYVTGFNLNINLIAGFVIFDVFQNIPDNQNTAITLECKKFEKSLLIALMQDAQIANIVKNKNISSI